MKKELMTPDAIKEIESLIPDHEKALMLFGAQMYRDGIVKGVIVAGIGMTLGVIIGVTKDFYFNAKKEKGKNGKD